jgi:predicted Fe-Mo cluster-binding NifX family protein
MSQTSSTRLVAVAAEDLQGLDGRVGQHFGGSPAFVMAELGEEGLMGSEVVPNPNAGAHRPGFLPRFVVDLGARAIVCGGMGEKARAVFEHHGVEVVTGLRGSIRGALEAYRRGERGDGATCRQHQGHGHGRGHGSGPQGPHGCGEGPRHGRGHGQGRGGPR